MKKRLFSILTALCLCLTLLPTAAFAEGSTEEALVCTCETACTAESMNADCPVCGAEGASLENCVKYVKPADDVPTQPEGEPVVLNDGAREVSSAEELIAAVSAGGNIKMMDDITINGDLTIKGPVMLDLNNHELKATRIEINSEFTATGGTINDWVDITSAGGVIKGGTFSGTVVNYNVISGGTFRGKVGNCNLVVFNPSAKPTEAQITGGDFYGEVTNGPVNDSNASGTIIGGSFYGKVTNTGFSMITGGDFHGEVVSNAQRYLWNGIPYGCITGGTFYDGLTDNSTGENSVQTWTVTYMSFGSEYARQVVLNDKSAAAPTFGPNGFTFLGWYTDEACTEEYNFYSPVTKDITLYAKWQGVSYNLRITDAGGTAYNVTSENAKDVLGDGSRAVVYTPGYVDANKNFTTDDWNKALRGETVEGIQLPKLTLNGANLQSIRMEGVYGDDENMQLLSTILQIELVGDNKINCSGDDAIYARMLVITGAGSLNATATGQNAAAIAVESEGGRYYQYGGNVTLYGEYSGIYCTEAHFGFAAGKLTASSPKSALYCELNDLYFNITSDTTTFFCGISENNTFEIQKPFDPENIHRQLKEKQCYFVPVPENETILYAQLISNHTVSFDAGNGDVIDDQIIVWGEKATAPEDPVRRGYTFAGWYLDENEFNFDTPVTKDLTLTAKWTANQYTITYDLDGGTAGENSPTIHTYGTSTIIPDPTRSGYTFAGWLVNGSTTAVKALTLGAADYTSDISLKAIWTRNSSGGSGSPSYSITLPDKTEHGTVTANRRYAERGNTVTITVTPDSGYVLETISVTDRNGNDLKLTDRGDGKYTFTMPGGKVEIKATFMEDNSVLNFFYDVPNDAYYYEAVKWAVENGVTGGVGNNLFAPNQPCTRAQIVTFLWRAAGSPVVNYLMPFTDVDEGAYYAEAVRWALSEGITTGTGDGKFSPNATCTRAQSAVFLYRYMQSQGKGFTGDWMFQLPFTDVPEWCYEAVAWCYMENITNGSTATTFSPNDNCTRAQIVAMLYRLFAD